MHIGLRHSYYQAMIGSGIGLMVLTAYVTTRADLAPILQAPFDLLVITFSSITVIGGLISRTHCMRLNSDIDEGKFEKKTFKLVKEGKVYPKYFALFEEPVKGKDGEFDSIRLLPKRVNYKLFDGRQIDGEVVIDRTKDIPIAVHFDEDFIFAKLSTLSAMPLPRMSPKAVMEETVGKCLILLIFVAAMLLMARNDIGYLITKIEFEKASQASPEQKLKLANQLVKTGATFPNFDARVISSKLDASRYFIDVGQSKRALEELESAKINTGSMSDPNTWKGYVLLGKGRVLQATKQYDLAVTPLEESIGLLKQKHNIDLLIPIIGWWQYRQTNTVEIRAQAMLTLATAYDIIGNDEKAVKAYKELALTEHENYYLEDSELDIIRLASFYRRRGELEKANQEYYKVIKQVEDETAKKPKETGSRLVHLGLWSFEANELDCSEILFSEALKVNEKLVGGSQLSLALNLNMLAETLYLKGKFNEAKPYFEKSLTILSQEKTSGEWTWPELRLEDIKLKTNTGEYSIKKAQDVLKVRKRVFGINNLRVSSPLHSMANYYKKEGDFKKALKMYNQAITIRQSGFKPNHPEIHDLMNDYIDALRKSGKQEEANKLQVSLNESIDKPHFIF